MTDRASPDVDALIAAAQTAAFAAAARNLLAVCMDLAFVVDALREQCQTLAGSVLNDGGPTAGGSSISVAKALRDGFVEQQSRDEARLRRDLEAVSPAAAARFVSILEAHHAAAK